MISSIETNKFGNRWAATGINAFAFFMGFFPTHQMSTYVLDMPMEPWKKLLWCFRPIKKTTHAATA